MSKNCQTTLTLLNILPPTFAKTIISEKKSLVVSPKSLAPPNTRRTLTEH
nr:MAG TPA: hypothetical protein [Bacteriophage sp.]